MRFLIAEDEYFARKALCQSVLGWSQHAEIREAENGAAALGMIRREAFDVLLLDIRMPQMDGLTLAQLAHEQLPDAYMIMITGYGEFQMAQAALRASVKDYLLKPVDDNRLVEALTRAQEYCEAVWARRRREEELVKGGQRMRGRLRRLRLQRWLMGEGDGRPPLELPGEGGAQASCVVWILAAQRGEAEQVEQVVARALGEDFADCVVLPARQDEIAVLTITRAGDPLERRRRMFIELERGLAAKGLRVRIGGGGLQPLQHAPESLRQARHALNYRLLRPDPILLSAEVKDQSRYVSALVPSEAAQLFSALEQGREQEALAIAGAALGAIASDGGASIASLQDVLNRIGNCLNRAVALSMGDAPGEVDAPPESLRVDQMRDWASLLEAVESGIRRVCKLRAQASTSTEEVVGRLKQLIAEHYAENISLKELAESRFFLNPSYLSRLFKAGTGISFRQHLTDVRLERACAMLRGGDMSVMRIASECGYGDASQFIQQFRKRFGVTPSVWRANQGGETQQGGHKRDTV